MSESTASAIAVHASETGQHLGRMPIATDHGTASFTTMKISARLNAGSDLRQVTADWRTAKAGRNDLDAAIGQL